jgi:hypothetical protein
MINSLKTSWKCEKMNVMLCIRKEMLELAPINNQQWEENTANNTTDLNSQMGPRTQQPIQDVTKTDESKKES